MKPCLTHGMHAPPICPPTGLLDTSSPHGMDSGHGTSSEDGSVGPHVGLTGDFDVTTFGLASPHVDLADLHEREADREGPAPLWLAWLAHQHAPTLVCGRKRDMGHRASEISAMKVHLVQE